jgi:hypothetical protein
MTQYDNNNRGVLFENDRKSQDSQPDMKGTLNVNGVDHWFSAWWKQGKNGQFLSLSLGQPKEQQQQQRPQGNRPPSRGQPPGQQRGAPPRGGHNDPDDAPW